MSESLIATANITKHGDVLWESVNGTVIRIIVLGPFYPAPTAPAPPAFPAPVPLPMSWLLIIITLMAITIVAVIIVWWYGYRKEEGVKRNTRDDPGIGME